MESNIKIVNHPDFDSYQSKYINWENLILGGNHVESGGYIKKYGNFDSNFYLRQAAHEPDNQWEIRQWLSCYRNYALPIVSVFSSAVWRKEPIRVLPEILQPYVKDVDRKGTSANVFFQNITWWSAVHGITHVLVDMPKLPEDKPRTIAVDKQNNIRPYFNHVSALNVPTWRINPSDGLLDFVVISSSDFDVVSPFAEAEKVNYYSLYHRDEWVKYFEDKKGIYEIDGGEYDINRVPIVQCYFRDDLPMVGDSVIAPISSLCIHAYRMSSSLDKSLYDTAFPLMVLLGFHEDDVQEFVRSSYNGLLGPADANAKFVEPNGRSFEDLRKAIAQDILDIQEIALRMIKPVGKQIQSAQSKREDRLQLDNQIAVFARNIENCEIKCWDMMLDWMGRPELKDEISIQYNRDFNLNQLSGEVLEAFSKMREKGDISRETFWKVLQQGEIPFPEDFKFDEEEERINNEKKIIEE